MTTLEKIDSVLNFLKSRQGLSAQFTKEYIWSYYIEKTPELEINSQLYNEIFITLLDNAFIRENKQLDDSPSTYHITVEGLTFSGFHQDYLNLEKDKSHRKVYESQMRNLTRWIAFGTVVAAIYYLFELLDKFFHIYPCKI
jgi:hypothetical protein